MTQTPAAPILHVQDLSFCYPEQAPLVSRWSAEIAAGVTLIHGDTGSGKSTLLEILSGSRHATGELALCGHRLDLAPLAFGQNVFRLEPADDAMSQLVPLEYARALCAARGGFDEHDWRCHVEGFGLTAHLHKPLYALSTGSRRKAGLAVALASPCPLTLLDEPSGALDAGSVAYLMQTLAMAAQWTERAIVVASAERLAGVRLAQTIELPLN